MKDFFKYVFASLTAYALLLGIAMFAGFFMLAFIIGASMGEQPKLKTEKGSILVVDLTMNITDQPALADPAEVLQEALSGTSIPTHYLLEIRHAIQRAAKDKNIAGILLKGTLLEDNYGSGFPVVAEVRRALLNFKRSGKPVIAYLEQPSYKDYLLATAADEIHLNPSGLMTFNGLGGQRPFLKQALDKYGIGMDVLKAGQYKSFVEMFTRTEMSEADKEQSNALLDGVWQQYLEAVASARKLDVDRLEKISRTKGILLAGEAQLEGFVDMLSTVQEVAGRMEEIGRYDEDWQTFRQVALGDYIARNKAEDDWYFENIAVVYAEGEIVPGEGAYTQAGAERIARYLRQARRDAGIEAVVLRVNSPGGSVFASEVISQEATLLAAQKPLVVSMGTLAASGGYWISLPGHYLFADENTVTGSIGVFGLLPNVKELANRNGVTFDGVQTSPLADMFSLARPRTEQEMAVLQGLVDTWYGQFVEKVAYSRNMTFAEADAIAQGRTWTGQDALQEGLVDAMGGLGDAIDKAAEFAGIDTGDVVIRQYPSEVEFNELLATFFQEHEEMPFAISARPGTLGHFIQQAQKELATLQSLNDPTGIYARLPLFMPLP